MIIELEDAKFELTPIGSMDRSVWAEAYSKWVNNEEVTKFLYQGTIPTSIQKCEELYDTLTNDNHIVFNILKLDHKCYYVSKSHVGIVGVFDIYWPSRVGEFRILIGDPKCWNKGVGQKSLGLMNAIAFERLGLHKFWLGYNANHKMAKGAYSKAGFQHECVLKSHHYKNGVYNDIVRLCMFKEDYDIWKKSKPD